MRIELNGCRPFSINKAYYKRTFTMTKDCRIWRQTIIEEAKRYKLDFNSFRSKFNPEIHGLSVAISYHIPEHAFFTTKGDISRRSMDLTNVEKLLVDILFDERFHERGELDNLNLDDKYIIKLFSEKIPSFEWKIIVEFKLIDITNVRKIYEQTNKR